MPRLYILSIPLFTAAGLALMGPTPAAQAQEGLSAPSPQSQRGRLVPRTYAVPMADGATLATDVWLPRGRGPWPVIVHRTPYGRKFDNGEAAYASEGYAVVVQDVRGRYGSEGEYDAFRSDGWGENADGRETIEWALSQPWADGSACLSGASASGITTYLGTGAQPDGLACAWAAVATGDLYNVAVFQGGAFRQEMVNGWLGSLQALDVIELIEEHPVFDDYWAPIYLPDVAEELTTPTYHLGGWFDPFQQGNLDAFVGITEGAGPSVAASQILIMGPWTHGAWSRPEQGQITFPENSVYSPTRDRDRFFDHHLKGGAPLALPRVQYYLMGAEEEGAPGNVWVSGDTWPPEATDTPLYLRRDGSLTDSPPGAASPSFYTYDPLDPVPTEGGPNLLEAAGPRDQQLVEARRDVLTFTTDPLTEPVAVAGRLTATLWVSSSALDTDFTVKLTDVYPDGRSMWVADGILRMRAREGVDQEVMMVPGEVYEIDVDLWSTAMVFAPGHSIRVAVSSSNSPRFEPNSNTGEPFHEETAWVTADQTLYHDALRASHIRLPVIALP